MTKCDYLQGLTQVEEMLISAVLPVMSLYKLPHGQCVYSRHVIKLLQDVTSFANTLLQLSNEIVIRKEGAADSHHNFHVRQTVVLHALQWLVVNNKYYKDIRINTKTLEILPEDGDLTDLQSISVESIPNHIEGSSKTK